MPRYQLTLEQYLKHIKYKLSYKSICHIGTQLLNIFEHIHSAGYVFNDLKPDNIMLETTKADLPTRYTDENCFERAKIKLIDFGCTTRYVDSHGQLKQKEMLTKFRGNLVFCSVNQMRFHSTSRRDDLISLCYFLAYLFNRGSFGGMESIKDVRNIQASFVPVRNLKVNLTVEKLYAGHAEPMKNFFESVFKLRFVDEPDYRTLKD